MEETTTIEFEIPTSLLESVDDCFEYRGFNGREEFIIRAVRDAVDAEDPFTEEAREEINRIKDEMEEGNGIPLEEVEKELDLSG